MRPESVRDKGQKRGEDYDPKTNIRSMEINWDGQGNMLIIRSDKKSNSVIVFIVTKENCKFVQDQVNLKMC